MKFKEFGFTPEVMDGLDAMRFETATPVQAQTIPVIRSGADLIACAQTGTRKDSSLLASCFRSFGKWKSTKYYQQLFWCRQESWHCK